jgi:Cu-Zn family superoxide dismutase
MLRIFLLLSLLSNCAHHEKNDNAIAVITSLKNDQRLGFVKFTQSKEGIKIKVVLKNITPGKHGFHVHEFGDLSLRSAKYAGGHFNPHKKQHGHLQHKISHIGDLGNITANSKGKVSKTISTKKLSLYGKHSIIGRSIIIHAKADDFKGKSGNAGKRIAGGVIGISK